MDNFPILQDTNFFRVTSSSLDAQGRIIIPKHWRDVKDDETTRYILTPGYNNSISFYSEKRFADYLEQARRAPNQKEAQTYLNIWCSCCQEIKLDKQGRFTPDPTLLNYAGITKQIACVGGLTHGSLYDQARWDQVSTEPVGPEVPLTPEEEAALTKEQKRFLNITKAVAYIGSL